MTKRPNRLISAITVSILLFVVSPVLGSEETQRSGWLQLDLVKTTIADTPVYYEPALEPNLPTFEQHLRALLEERTATADLLGRKEEIVADINRILGVVDANDTKPGELLAQLVGVFAQTQPTYYLVRTSTIKDFLRAGGELPGCTYDSVEDQATYNPEVRWQAKEGPPETLDLCVPVPSEAPFEEYVSTVLQAFGGMRGLSMQVAIHEITEMMLLRRLRPTDPYCRWFSDGFAEAITFVLVEKYVGGEAAKESVTRDLEPYRELEKEVNLAYWMTLNFAAYVTVDNPVERESEFRLARYAYAMFEAQRLVQEHGIECVAQILDAMAARDSRGGSDLLEVIQEVTGTDMTPRLARYQTFATREEGLSKYAEPYETATAQKNWESLVFYELRMMELRANEITPKYLQGFGNVALYLFRLGHEDAGDEVMQKAIELFSQAAGKQGHAAALELYLNYAVMCNNPAKAEKEADELLQTYPDIPAGLGIKMLDAMQRRDLATAQDFARRIQENPQRSVAYRFADSILAIDPNDPNTFRPAPRTR